MFRPWLNELQRRFYSFRRQPRRRKPEVRPTRPAIETLEVRQLPSTFTVLNANDSGTGSLRQALLDSNAAGGSNLITFNIAASGVQTITPLSALPNVTASVVIDATTEPGYAGAPIVVLSGGSAGAGVSGLTITAGGSTVQGLVINGFSGAGIVLSGGAGDLIAGDYIGTDATGAALATNSGGGLYISSANNTVGGLTAAACNVIAGQTGAAGISITGSGASGNVVAGNYVGLNAAGGAALGGFGDDVNINSGATANTVGGATAGARNVLAGASFMGVAIYNDNTNANVVAGNYIGTNAAGSAALGNHNSGVAFGYNNTAGASGNVISGNLISGNPTGIGIDPLTHNTLITGNLIGTTAAGTAALGNGTGVSISGPNNTVGGTTVAARNIISGNGGNGVQVVGSSATGNVVQGNYVGTDVNGTAKVGNAGSGVALSDTRLNTVRGNVISGNGGDGVSVNTSLAVYGNGLPVDFTGDTDPGRLQFGSVTDSNDLSWTVYTGYSSTTLFLAFQVKDDFIDAQPSDPPFFNDDVEVFIDGDRTANDFTPSNRTGSREGFQLVSDVLGHKATTGSGISNNDWTVSTSTITGGYVVEFQIPLTLIDTQDGAGFTPAAAGSLLRFNAASVDNDRQVSGQDTYAVLWKDGFTGPYADGEASWVSDLYLDNGTPANSTAPLLLTAEPVGNVVDGNFIGTNAAGNAALGNSGAGVRLTDAAGNTVGGSTAAARNVIAGNAGTGVVITGSRSAGNLVAGDYVGTNAAGTAKLANGSFGVQVTSGASANTVGGTSAATRNVISGNASVGVYVRGASNNVVAGNYIGTDFNGTAALGNADVGVQIDNGGSGNTVGGTVAAAANVISDDVYGVFLRGSTTSSNVIAGNRIGTNAAGTAALGNHGYGVAIDTSAFGNTVGGSSAAARNVISGNANNGVQLAGGPGNVVADNFIGTNLAGTARLANSGAGVNVAAASNTIISNLIAGNSSHGIQVSANNTLVQANTVGLNSSGTTNVIAVANNGFEVPDQGSGSAAYHYNPTGGSWTFSGATGVAANNSAWGFTGATNGNSNGATSTAGQAAFIQNGNGSTTSSAISQTLSGFVAGTVTVTFSLEARAGFGSNPVKVMLDGTTLGTFTPVSSTAFNVITTTPVAVTAGSHTLYFVGTSPNGDNDTFIDNVSVANGVGGLLGNSGDGIFITSAGNAVGGTTAAARNVISGNASRGVELNGAGASANLIAGNYIGTDVAGSAALGNSGDGIGVVSAGPGNTIGGTAAGAGNVIAGNGRVGIWDASSSNELIAGNRIGTNAAGTAALGNGLLTALPGVWLTSGSNNNTVGGTSASAGNVISANGAQGIQVNGSGNLVQGNYLGTNAAGNAALGNSYQGVYVSGASNTIGGGAAGAGNVVSGSLASYGVQIDGSGASANLVAGNLVGTDRNGTANLGNAGSGIEVSNGATANVIGTNGDGVNDAAERNVASGNGGDGISLYAANNNVIAGNYTGTNAAGTAAIPNLFAGIALHGGSSNNVIGTNADGVSDSLERNLASGNRYQGIWIGDADTNANVVAGNYVGTNAAGTLAVPNGGEGVSVHPGTTGNRIGTNGDGVNDAAERNLISGNAWVGVWVDGASSVVVAGNSVGTDVTGTHALGNGSVGVYVNDGAQGVRIGADGSGVAADAAMRNIISGNAWDAVQLYGVGTNNNLVAGNYIGTDVTGLAAVPNAGGSGVAIFGGASNNRVGTAGVAADVAGERNVIAGSASQFGVFICDGNTTGNLVAGNYIGLNAAGTAALPTARGVYIQAAYNTVGGTAAGMGNVISGNNGLGIHLSGGPLLDGGNGTFSATANLIEGNYVGTNAAGTAAVPNTGVGVQIDKGATGNTLGGNTAGARNVISGNGTVGVYVTGAGTSGNLVAGNYLGTDKNGTAALGNAQSGIEIDSGASGNTVGGLTATPGTAPGNVISGNGQWGVLIGFGANENNNLVAGNVIGLNAAGTAPVGNTYEGVLVADSSGNTVGGSAAGARNIISANGGGYGQIEISFGSTNTVVQGNYLGTDVTGTQGGLDTNYGNGITIVGASNNLVGGTVAGAGNVISGNATGILIVNATNFYGSTGPSSGNVVQGNRIGTDASGTASLGNLQYGISVSADFNTIGGAGGAGNLISGNGQGGVQISAVGLVGNLFSGTGALSATGNVLQGNFIGTDVNGTAALGNAGNGVSITNGASGNVVGTNGDGVNDAAEGNVISGNSYVGVDIAGAGTNNNVLAGNLIGTDVTGTRAVPNGTPYNPPNGGGGGVLIDAQAAFNRVGTNGDGVSDDAERNVISGNSGWMGLMIQNASDNTVAGNYVGTAADGLTALPNVGNGFDVKAGSQRNVIGTNGDGVHDGAERNVISGNGGSGILLWNNWNPGTADNVVAGNYIGTDKTGTGRLGNANYGVIVAGGTTNNTVGGVTAAARNVISANGAGGVVIQEAGTTGNVVQGNSVGLDAAGAVLGNGGTALMISGASSNTVGGTAGGAGNFFAGANIAISVDDAFGPSNNNVIQGNFIGTDAGGTLSYGVGTGIDISGSSAAQGVHGTVVGGSAAGGNVIAHLSGSAVVVRGQGSDGTTIVGNSIHDNGGLAIDLGGDGATANDSQGHVGPNNYQDYPILLSFTPGLPTTVSGRFGTAAGVTFSLDLYTNGGAVYLGSQSVTTAAGGAFSVTLPGSSLPSEVLIATATDPAGNTSEFGAPLAYQGYSNTSPTVAINGPASPIVGAPVSLSGVVSDPTPNKTYTYAWTLTHSGDATFALPAGTDTGAPNLVFVPTAPGTYVATLRVTDNLGGSGSATFTLNVGVPGPGIVIQVASTSASAGSAVSLTSSVSEPTGATPTRYAWSVTLNGSAYALPRGTATDQPNFTFTPTASGLYGVSLSVTDSAGGQSSTSIYLSVTGGTSATAPPAVAPPVVGKAPTPVITSAPTTAAAGSTITLTASAPADATLSWSVSRDGQQYNLPPGTVTNAPTFSFLAADVGLYVVTVTATNAAGRGSAVAAITVGAATVPVTLVPSGPFQAGAPASVVAQVANAAPGVTYTFHFTLTGSSSSSQATQLSPSSSSFTFTPAAAGPYTVAVSVTGSDGSSGTASQTFSVAAPPSLPPSTPAPTVTISGAPANATLGASYTLTGSASTAGATLHWQVVNQATGRTASATGPTFAYQPLAAGSEVITLTSTDAGGNVLASASVTVQVSGALTLTLAPAGSLQPWAQDQVQAAVSAPASGVTYTFIWNVVGQGGIGFAASGPGTPTGAAGSSFLFEPRTTGSYQVTVTAQGSDGSSGSATLTVSVAPATPLSTTLNLPSGGTVSDGTPLELTATVSGGTTQAAPGVLNYQWTVTGPSGFSLSSTAAALDFTAPRWGAYTVALTTTDAAGDTATATGNLLVKPVIRNAQVPAFNGPNFTAFLTTTTPPAGSADVFTYEWSVLDGQGHVVAQQGPGADPTFSFTGVTGAVYSVALTVRDGHGNAGTAGTLIQVAAPFSTTTLTAPAQPAPQLLVVGGDHATIDASQLPATVTVVEVASGGHNVLIAGPGPSILVGDTGNNTLQGGTGPDTLIGTGSDTLIGGTGASNLFEITQATAVNVVAGSQNNTLSFAQLGSGVALNLSATSGLATLAGGSVSVTGAFQAVIGSSAGNNALTASGLSNILLQAAGANNLLAVTGGASVTMFGGAGNDTLSSSGASNITMIAGTGSDSLSAVNGTGVLMQANTTLPTLSSSGGTSVTLFGAAGSDTLSSSGGTGITMVGGAGNDLLSSVGGTGVVMQAGTGVVTVPTAGGSSVTLFGGTGNDTLSATAGSGITMVGGTGSDSLSAVNSSNVLISAGTPTVTGGSSVTLFGGTGNDTLSATGGTGITLVGGLGNDSLSSSGGTGVLMQSGTAGGSSLTLFGGAGNETLSSSGGTGITLIAGVGNDLLSSSGGSSITMFGGTGSDTLSSSGGTGVTMIGGAGNATLSASNGSNVLIQSGSTATGSALATVTGGSSITMFGGTGSDTLSASGGTNITMVAGSGNSTLSSSGGSSITMFGGSGNDSLSSSGGTQVSMVGGSGNATLASSGGSSITLFGGAGNDSLSARGGSNVTMTGGAGNDLLTSSGGSSITMFGGTGSDTLSASAGNGITMVGGTGNNVLSAASSNNVLILAGTPTVTSSGGSSITLFGGTGNDTLTATGGTGVTLVGGTGNSTLSASGASNVLIQSASGSSGSAIASTTGGSSITMFGGAGNDTLASSAGSGITLVGGTGSDSLSVANGSNALILAGMPTVTSSGGSSVTLFGGTGNDTLAATGGSNVTMVGGSGNSTLSASGASSVLIQSGSAATGSALATATGGSSITMFGGAGSDTLVSSGGSGVTMVAGSGNDSLSATNGSGAVLVASNGTPTVTSSGGSSITLFGATGNDTLASSGGTGVTMVGGSGNDSLASSGGTRVALLAGAGNTTLSASGGSSVTLFGGSGNDSLASSGGSSVTMIGGAGNSTLSSTNGAGVVMAGGGNATLSSSGGTSVTMFGGTGSDSLSATGGSSITMVSGSGSDTLSATGGTGVSMIGGSGNTTLSSSGGSSITLFGGSGNESISASGGTGITMVGGSGSDSLSATNATQLVIQTGSVGSGALATTTGGSSITMFGGAGNDTLASSGGSGITLVGGTGSDSLSATNGTGVVLLGGVPTITSSGGTSVTLFGGAGNETLSASGGSSITIIGGTGNDTLSATNANNVLIQSASGAGGSALVSNSGGSSVTMFGGAGSDTLSSSGGSGVTLVGGSGSDSLASSNDTSTTLLGGSGNATLTSSGGSSISLFGGAGNDSLAASGGTSITLVGGSGSSTLSASGASGAILVGGSGNATLSSSGGSSITMFGGTGNDSLSSTGGTGVTLLGGSGNSTLTSSGGTGVSMQGGSGNATLSSSGCSSITMFGGTGNDSLTSSGGTSLIMVGGTGNDTLSASGASGALIIGGSGNATLSSSGGSSITMFGGSGNDSLLSSGGTHVSMTGGSGSDTLSSANDSNAVLQAGGSGNDALTSTGGTSVTLFGGAGNDTLWASGGTAIGLDGLQGNNTYEVSGSAANPISVTFSALGDFGQDLPQTDAQTIGTNTILFPGVTTGIRLDLSNASSGAVPTAAQIQPVAPGVSVALIGQFQNVVGTPGDDWIHGGASSNVLDGGGTGNDTLAGGSGPATLVAGSGNDSLVAGTGGTTFRFAGSSFGAVTVDPPAGGPVNLLDFSAFGGPVALDLRSTAGQALGHGLVLTLQSPQTINALADSAFDDNITGNSAGDLFYVGAGNDTFIGFGGDTYFFAGSKLGNVSINETGGNTLNFYGFGGGINLDLGKAGAQVLSQAPGSSLTLTLSNPAAFSAVVGTPYADDITGGAAADATIIGGGGGDSLVAGNGNTYLQGKVTQVVYLQFPADGQTPAGMHVYTADEQAAILRGLQQDYAAFNYFFTLDPQAAQQHAALSGGKYATLMFNAGGAGGSSSELDPGNTDLGGTSLINVNPFLGDASAGLVPPTSANIVALTTTIAAHELGHLSGLQHQDAFEPIGAGIYGGVPANKFFPGYTGSQQAFETPQDIMASPASVGTTLMDAAQGTYFGARDDVKLAFNDTGTVLSQQALVQEAVSQHGGPSDLSRAYYLPSAGGTSQPLTLPALAVPNTLPATARDAGKTFNVTALAINGTLTTKTQEDFYAFTGQKGQEMTFEVISNNDTLNAHPIIPELVLVGPDGTVLAYNVHGFESADSTLLDVTLPTDGTYYLGVDSLLGLTTGNYQLFMYSFATGTGPSSAGGDTLVGGNGNTTLVGSSGNDLFTFLPGATGTAVVVGGSGQSVLDLSFAPKVKVTATGDVTIQGPKASATATALTAPVTSSGYGQTLTITATVTAASGNAPTGTVDFKDTATGQDLGSAPVVTTNGTSQATLTVTGLSAGGHTIAAYYTSDDAGSFENSSSADLPEAVTPATPTVGASDGGGQYNGAAFTAAVTVTGVSGTPSAGLEGLSPIVLYYGGTSATGTPLAAVPTDVGTYTVLAVFPGTTNYTAATAQTTFTITPAPLTVSGATAASKVYDATRTAALGLGSATLVGVFGHDDVSLLTGGAAGTFDTKDVGSGKMVTVSGLALGGSKAGDYVLNQPTLTADVTPRPLTISAVANSKTYDGDTTAVATPAVSGLQGSSDNVTGLVEAYDNRNAGTGKTLTVTGYTVNDGNGGKDYAVTTVASSAGTIAARPITVTAAANSKVYDGTTGAAATPTITAGSLVKGDTGSFTETYDTANAGTGKTLTPAGSVSDGNGGKNYAITFQPTPNGTITAASPAFTGLSASQSIVYGAASVSVSGTLKAGGLVPPGSVTITAGSATTTATVGGDGTFKATLTTSALPASATPYALAYSYHDTADGNFADARDAGTTLTVNKDGTTTVVTSSGASSVPFGQKVTLTAAVTANAPGSGTPTGSVDFFDTTTNTDLGTATLSGGVATLATANLAASSQTITTTYGGDANFLTSQGTLVVTPVTSIYVLNTTASAALSLSGNGTITIPGLLMVDSKSATAVSLSGNAQVTAGSVQVVGGVSLTGTAQVSPKPATGAAAVADPLAGLAAPAVSGPSLGAVNVSGTTSLTINPGIYSQISVSGKGTLVMKPGVYVIAGGGFTVTGTATVTGSGVLIYNAGSNYPGTGGNFGGVTLSGTAQVNLTAPTSGPYAGIVLFQARDNARALSLAGEAVAGLNGATVYAPAALLTVGGNGQLGKSALVVNQLLIAGNGINTLTVDGGSSNSDNAGQLLAGDLEVYVDNAAGTFTADELARIDDAIAATDGLLVPYSVHVAEVYDRGSANVVVSMSTTSAAGGYADGVLGAEAPDGITLIEGWDWYTGADPTAIGGGQYDFETIVTHELGHALGLGHSADAKSVMYATLEAGQAKRGLTVADLNVPDADAGVCALHAAPAHAAPLSGPPTGATWAAAAAVLDVSSATGRLPAELVHALRTAVPAYTGAGPLPGGPGGNLLVGGDPAAERTALDAVMAQDWGASQAVDPRPVERYAAPTARSSDDYFQLPPDAAGDAPGADPALADGAFPLDAEGDD